MRATEHALLDPFDLFERRHGLTEFAKRAAAVLVECLRLRPPHQERGLMTIAENPSRHGHYFAQQSLGFCVVL